MISANLRGLTISIASPQCNVAVLPVGCRCVGNQDPAGEGKVSMSKEQPLGNHWLWRVGSHGRDYPASLLINGQQRVSGEEG